ncbi:helix-turn-helix domain-containing protein, partial [Enterobacter kobei]|uniref:helix-turn-helix domain-containing protein n=2 Tax=Enterobacter kobei TaxID=208224 RepID=UPI002FD7CFFE
MSSKILGNVWDACAAHDIKGAKLVIMARLADYSNDDGVCYPSVETICRQLGLGESTVRTAIAELESAGWLRRESRRKGNRNTSNLYHLNADRLEALARIEKDKVFGIELNWGFPANTDDTLKTEIQYSLTGTEDDAMLLADVPYPQRKYQQMGLKAG